VTAVGFFGLALTGALVRAVVSDAANRPSFPWGTLAVNVTGSFLLGLLAHAGSELVTTAGVGGIGSLTTFSTFSHEWVSMAGGGARVEMISYLATTVGLSVAAAWVGLALAP